MIDAELTDREMLEWVAAQMELMLWHDDMKDKPPLSDFVIELWEAIQTHLDPASWLLTSSTRGE